MTVRRAIVGRVVRELLTNGFFEEGDRVEIKRGVENLGGWGQAALAFKIAGGLSEYEAVIRLELSKELAEGRVELARVRRELVELQDRILDHATSHKCTKRRRSIFDENPPPPPEGRGTTSDPTA